MAIIILGVPLPPKEQGERPQAFPAPVRTSARAGTSSEKHSLRKLHQKENVLTDMFTVNVALHTKKSGLRKTGLFCSAYEDLN